MADKKTVQDLLADEIKDLYSAEKQLTKAIPKMAKGSNDESLKAAFSGHLKETEGQVERLDKVAKLLGISPTGKKWEGTEGGGKGGCEGAGREGRGEDGGMRGGGARAEE